MQIKVNGKDITIRTGNITRSGDVDGLAEQLTFDVVYNDGDKFFSKFEVNPGDKVVFTTDDGYAFAGIVTDEERNGIYVRKYTAHDYGWYLNKNEVIAQFKKMPADAAIKKLCGDFNVQCNVCAMPTKISKIYNGEVLSDVIKDIIEQVEADQAKSYRMEMRNNVLTIEPYKDLVVTASFKLASNIAPINPMTVPGNVTMSRSIADMSNSIKVTSGGEKDSTVIAEKMDSASIAKYGLLQHVEKIDNADKAQAGNVAKNKLLELNKVKETNRVTFLGDDKVIAGRIVVYNGKGYQVKSHSHKYEPLHTMTLELEAIE